ncbi:hypothetical protein [Aeoliella sp.]|uniref:hypothetical protein n=1 Tax=Aeoliella sp. TaxID=2795800 RepID=UPI003CCB7A3F
MMRLLKRVLGYFLRKMAENKDNRFLHGFFGALGGVFPFALLAGIIASVLCVEYVLTYAVPSLSDFRDEVLASMLNYAIFFGLLSSCVIVVFVVVEIAIYLCSKKANSE